jgi:hypothetical protein
MKGLIAGLILACVLVGCATPNRLVYSSGFSFANYDYVVIAKSDGRDTTTSLYGMDVEFANLISRYNMKVIGDKEYDKLPLSIQKRTLNARMSVTASNKRILLAVSFDDAITGRTGSSITALTRGDIFDLDDRTKTFEAASETIVKALRQDKGLQITDEKK